MGTVLAEGVFGRERVGFLYVRKIPVRQEGIFCENFFATMWRLRKNPPADGGFLPRGWFKTTKKTLAHVWAVHKLGIPILGFF